MESIKLIGKEEGRMRVIVCAVLIGIIFLWSGNSFANGGVGGVKGGVVSEPIPVSGKPLKSPGFATTLSLLVPGFGQIYNDDPIKALIMIGLEGVCWGLALGSSDLDGVGIMGMVMGRVVSPVDAYYGALEENKGLSLRIDSDKVVLAIKSQF